MTPADVFKNLKPATIVAYLLARDWREVEPRPVGDPLTYYVCLFHEPPHETAFPRSDHWTDYGLSVAMGLRVVAECEGRPSPVVQLYREMQGLPSGRLRDAAAGDCRPDARYEHSEG